MEKEERLAWGNSFPTKDFLRELTQRFQPGEEWARTSNFDRVNMLRGQKEVLDWIFEEYLK
jgi:hypothetical protein